MQDEIHNTPNLSIMEGSVEDLNVDYDAKRVQVRTRCHHHDEYSVNDMRCVI